MDTPQSQPVAELTLTDILLILKRYRKLIAGIWLLCVVFSVLAAVFMTPVYRAEAQVAAAAEGAASGGDLSSLINRFSSVPGMGSLGRLSQQDTLTESMVTLRSPQFLMEFIRAEKLKPVMFDSIWDSETKQWAVDNPDEVPSDEDAYIFFRDELLRIAENKATPGIITVAIEWRDREQAALWANDLITRLNDRLRHQAIDEANQTIEYLNKELQKARIVEVRQAIYFMLESQINLRTMANVREEFALKVLSHAVAPDIDRYISPNRPFIVVMGFFIGLVLGIFVSFLLFAIGRLRADLNSGSASR